jgi:hypothetical protein
MTAADVNADGKPDLVLTNSGSGDLYTVKVLLNTTANGAMTPKAALNNKLPELILT